MKKLITTLLLSAFSIISYAQLTEGKYRILSVSGFVNGKTVYENFFEKNDAIVRVTTDNIVNIVIKGYSVLTYSISSPVQAKGCYVYNAKEVQSGLQTTILSQRNEEYPSVDGGIFIVNRSKQYSDIFLISKEN